MTGLDVTHQRALRQAREHVETLRDLKLTDMSEDDQYLWLVRLEIVSRDLLNIVTVLGGAS